MGFEFRDFVTGLDCEVEAREYDSLCINEMVYASSSESNLTRGDMFRVPS